MQRILLGVKGHPALGVIQRRNAGRAQHEITARSGFKPLSDENFSSRKVRELRAYPWSRKNAQAFFRLFNTHYSRELRIIPCGHALCRRLSKLRFSSLSGWNRRRGDFASGDQLAQLDRGRTGSPARIKIAPAIFLMTEECNAFFSGSRVADPCAAGLKGLHES